MFISEEDVSCTKSSRTKLVPVRVIPSSRADIMPEESLTLYPICGRFASIFHALMSEHVLEKVAMNKRILTLGNLRDSVTVSLLPPRVTTATCCSSADETSN